MNLRVVAVLIEPDTAPACLAAASRAAGIVPGSMVEAFHPRSEPESFIIPSDEVMTGKRRAELRALLDGRSRALRAVVNKVAASAGAGAPAWHEIEAGTIAAAVAACAASADLLVLARPEGPDGEAALHAAIFDSNRLLLLAPRDAGAAAAFGRHVAIAWKAGDKAERAVTAALPWLARAEHVSVLAVGKPPAASPDDALALLAARGIAADSVPLESDGGDVAARILHEAQARGADCLVLGAYRHGQLLETVLGGVTRDILRDAALPLFMMH